MTTLDSSKEIQKNNSEFNETHEDFRMFGLITFLIADGMTFAGFFAAYLTYKAVNPLPDGAIYELELPIPTVNTILLLVSSATFHKAGKALLKDKNSDSQKWLFFTAFLGLIFLICQLFEYFHLPYGLTDNLIIESISEVETIKHPNIIDGVKNRDLTLPFCRSIINRDLQGALEGWMPNGQHDPSAVELAQEALAGSINNALSFTYQLIEIIQDRVKYTKRHTGPAWPASRTLRERIGSCRDLAMLMVEACRSIGIPSRFVSGYHFEDPLPSELDLHAWAELYIPGAGWRGFDPSGKGLIDDRYLTLVSSSKSNLTSVITGNFIGKNNLENTLSWEIKPLEIK